MKLITIFVAFSLLSLSVFGDVFHISSADDFIEFVNKVNLGEVFESTVYLDADIDFSGKSVDVIGKDTPYFFIGTFDGQGHIISNLKINSNSQYGGLFGFSNRMVIKNVCLDESCSIESSYSSSNDDAYIGGIVGYCESENDDCIIESIVNMGSVTFSGSFRYLYFGGIVGYLKSLSYTSTVKNCANYGTITHSGIGGYYSYLGGIVGFSEGSWSKKLHIQNCLNYGAITGNSVNSYRLGGIVGEASYTKTDNCVSAGIITGNSNSGSYYGSIVGGTDSNTYITNCFWTSDAGYNKANGNGNPTIDDETSQIKANSEALKKLNTYSGTYSLNGWILNKNKVSVTFTMNNIKRFALNSQIILLPSLADEGKLMYLWYRDSACTTQFTETAVESATELYGAYRERNSNFTITFNTNGGTPVDAITSPYLSVVTLPTTSTKDGCTFAFWKNEDGEKVSSDFTVPARNVILTAMWACTHIASASDFIDFSINVNYGVDYSGTTVYLDADIDFSVKSVDVIGKDEDNYFQGTFDGQGHIISNLKIKSNLEYVGLFGYSKGLTIKDVVVDDTCSVESSYKSYDDTYLGGIIGKCCAEHSNCNIENVVNMGSVTFSGTTSDCIYFGGIAGYLRSDYYDTSTVKNCANYGFVTHSGTSVSSYIGGIVGYSYGYSSDKLVYIQNCLNYGTIIGEAEDSFRLGGIGGEAYEYTNIENCVSGGVITTFGSNGDVGSIVGSSDSYSSIMRCFWTSDVLVTGASGAGSPTIDGVSSQITNNSYALKKLNTYSTTNGWDNWVILYLNGGKISNINQENIIASNKYFPDPEKEGLEFAGWFKDSTFIEKYDPKTDKTVTDVYAKYGKKRGGSFSSGIIPLSILASILFFF